MALDIGPGQTHVLVKMQKEKTGRTSRTKYFIRVGDQSTSKILEPVHLPDGAFIVPVQANVGNSDYLKPQMPTPGDIRRMFGSDKIDSEPEYMKGKDPDWSRVSPTTPEELQNKINCWSEVTVEAMRKYHDTGEGRRNLDSEETATKDNKKPFSAGNNRHKSEQGGKRYNSADTSKSRKKDKKSKRVEHCRKEALTKCNVNSDEKERTQTPPQAVVSSGVVKKNDNIVTFTPSKLKLKSHTTAINIVQKMNYNHWLIIDMLYNDVLREKGIDFDYLSSWVIKIVSEIYGIECEFVLSTIDADPVERIVKLGRLMLNVYHEAMFGSKGKKKQTLVVPGINDPNFSKKCIQVYTSFSPSKTRSTRMTSKMYQNLTGTRDRPPRCEACYQKKKVNEKNQKVKRKNQVSNLKLAVYKTQKHHFPVKLLKNVTTKADRNSDPKMQKNNGRVNENRTKVCPKKSKIRFRFHSPPCLLDEQEVEHEDTSDESVDSMESGPTRSYPEEVEEKLCSDSRGPARRGFNIGGGDTTVARVIGNYNYLLTNLFEAGADDPPSGGLSEVDRFFTSTTNILQLNDQLEKMLFKDDSNDVLPCTQLVPSTDTDTDTYQDCELTPDEINTSPSLSTSKAKKKFYRYSKWMRLTDDCINHRYYISLFMTVMLGLTTAFFCPGSFINHFKANPALKGSVKGVIKTFLLGALRLVDGF